MCFLLLHSQTNLRGVAFNFDQEIRITSYLLARSRTLNDFLLFGPSKCIFDSLYSSAFLRLWSAVTFIWCESSDQEATLASQQEQSGSSGCIVQNMDSDNQEIINQSGKKIRKKQTNRQIVHTTHVLRT